MRHKVRAEELAKASDKATPGAGIQGACRGSARSRHHTAASGEQPAGFEEGVDLRAFTPFADGACGIADIDKSARFSQGATGQVLSGIEPLKVWIVHQRTGRSNSPS
jgi:hypothetical protein